MGEETEITAKVSSDMALNPGDVVKLTVDTRKLHFFDPDTADHIELRIGRPNERGLVREVPLGTVAVVPFHKTVLCLSRKTQANRRPLPWDSKQGLDKTPVGISRSVGDDGICPANRHRFRVRMSHPLNGGA